MAAVLRAGCIGLGNIFHDRHQVALEALPEWTITAMFDVDERACARASRISPGARICPGANDILDDPDIDVVVICTPPHLRRDLVIRAAENGKHLMLEKPIARRLDDARAMVAAIERADVACFVPFTRSYWPGQRKIIEIVRSGLLGRTVSFVHNSITPPYAYTEGQYAWSNDRDASGGPMFDYSIHFLDFALHTFDASPTVVTRRSGHYSSRTVRCEDVCTMVVEFDDGGSATFVKTSAVHPDAGFFHETCHVTCDRGVAVMPNGYQAEWYTDGQHESFAEPSNPDVWSRERFDAFTELADCIRTGRRPCVVSQRDGLRTMEILEAGFRGETLNRPVRLDEL